MKTSALRRPLNFIRWLPVCAATFWLAADTPVRAEKFSTTPQREAVDKAVGELDKATEKAAKAQQKAPTDAGQQGINGAEDAADAARDAANVAKDRAEEAREAAAEKAGAANTPKEVEEAKAAEKVTKDAAERAATAEKTAKEREADAKKAVDEQVKADKEENHGRRPTHDARQEKREARRRLADRIRELQRVWADTKLNPKKKGVTITEEERRATERKINEGRRELGLGEVKIFAALPVLPANSLCSLVAAQKIQADVTGTGKTIGHVANLRVKNLTNENVSVAVPPLVLESRSGKNQHYVCPRGETVAFTPQEEKVIKARGICVSRSKPPVGDGVGGDLLINDGSGQTPGTTFQPAQVDKLIRGVASHYDGADKLEKEGQLAKVPYKDPEMRREIVTQWSVWSDPAICTLTKETPATKEDLTKTVYRQTEQRTPVTPEIKQKLDTGITDIFTSIQLTTKEAKELEPASPFPDTDLTDGAARNDRVKIGDKRGVPDGPIEIDDRPLDDECAALRKKVEAADDAWWDRHQKLEQRDVELAKIDEAMEEAVPELKEAMDKSRAGAARSKSLKAVGEDKAAEDASRESYNAEDKARDIRRNDPRLKKLREDRALAGRRIESAEAAMTAAEKEFTALRDKYVAKCGGKYRAKVEELRRKEKKEREKEAKKTK